MAFLNLPIVLLRDFTHSRQYELSLENFYAIMNVMKFILILFCDLMNYNI
jgi:hypothetical protein